MATKPELLRLIEQIPTWPKEAQAEALAALQSIEQELQEPYGLTADDIASIKRGVADADAGRFATKEEVEALFARYRCP